MKSRLVPSKIKLVETRYHYNDSFTLHIYPPCNISLQLVQPFFHYMFSNFLLLKIFGGTQRTRVERHCESVHRTHCSRLRASNIIKPCAIFCVRWNINHILIYGISNLFFSSCLAFLTFLESSIAFMHFSLSSGFALGQDRTCPFLPAMCNFSL